MGGIPDFPDFARFDFNTKEHIHKITKKYPSYSEYNFINGYNWDLANASMVSILNNNLVLRSEDNIDGCTFYSFLGQNYASETAQIILDEAQKRTGERVLKLVPEIGALALQSSGIFEVKEDLPNNDLVISLPAIASAYGSRFRNLRHSVNNFESEYAEVSKFVEIDITDPSVQQEALNVFLLRNKLNLNCEPERELAALNKLFCTSKKQDLCTFGIEVNGILKAFIICEKIGDNWCAGHFWKADTTYRGIYKYLMYNLAKNLTETGYSKMNIMQDFGMDGLRFAKNHFCPVDQLKKYTITEKD